MTSMREGVVPTVLGTAVTAAGVTLAVRRMCPILAAGVLGFGVAHIVLGSIDMAKHGNKRLFG